MASSTASFVDVPLVEETPLESWRALFDAIGYPPGLSAGELAFDSILGALVGELSPALLDALEVLQDLGDEEGRFAILEAAEDQNADLSNGMDEGARELAVRLQILRRTDPVVDAVLTRAQIKVLDRLARRTSGQFVGLRPRELQVAQKEAKWFEEEMRRWFAANDMGDYLSLRVLTDPVEVQIQILHGARQHRHLVVDAGRRSVASYRPVHSDAIRYEEATGRLRINAGGRKAIDAYRKALGSCFFDDEQWFPERAICTLTPLQAEGAKALTPSYQSQVTRVFVRELHWQRNAGSRLVLTGRDCMQQACELELRLSEGELLEARLGIRVTGIAREQSVTIKVPDRIEMKQGPHQRLLENYLDEVGLRTAEPLDGKDDLWDLASGAHAHRRWRITLGTAFDRWVTGKLLLPDQAETVAHPDFPDHGCVLAVNPCGDGEYYGVSRDPGVPSRTLTASDIEVYRLDWPRLAARVAEGLGLQGDIRLWETDGFVDLGGFESAGRSLCRVLLLLRRPVRDPAGLVTLLRTVANQAPVALLVPKTRTTNTGLTELPLPSLDELDDLVALARLRPRLIQALNLHRHLPAIQYAPPESRFVLDPGRGQVWLDRVELTALEPGDQPHTFLAMLARADGQILSTEVLKTGISGSHSDEGIVKQAKRKLISVVKKSFLNQNLAPPGDLDALVRSQKGGYKLAVPAFFAFPEAGPAPQ